MLSETKLAELRQIAQIEDWMLQLAEDFSLQWVSSWCDGDYFPDADALIEAVIESLSPNTTDSLTLSVERADAIIELWADDKAFGAFIDDIRVHAAEAACERDFASYHSGGGSWADDPRQTRDELVAGWR